MNGAFRFAFMVICTWIPLALMAGLGGIISGIWFGDWRYAGIGIFSLVTGIVCIPVAYGWREEKLPGHISKREANKTKILVEGDELEAFRTYEEQRQAILKEKQLEARRNGY